MTRSEHYQAGYAEGASWGYKDAQELRSVIPHMNEQLRGEATFAVSVRDQSPSHDSEAAFALGRARGYRTAISDVITDNPNSNI